MKKDPRLEKFVAPKEVNELIGWWITHASDRNAEIGLDQYVINEAPHIVVNALGKQWFTEHFKNEREVAPLVSSTHPVVDWLKVPSAFQICSIVEFSRYLIKMCEKAGFDEVLRMLRDKQSFESAFLQLSTGFRFEHSGVDDLFFEPDVADGRRGDIQFNYLSKLYLCECFVPEFASKKGESELFRQAARLTFSEAQKQNKRVIVFTDLESINDFNQSTMVEIKKQISSLIREVTPEKELKTEYNGCKLLVCDTSRLSCVDEEKLFLPLYEKSTSGQNGRMVHPKDLPLIRKGIPVPGEISSRYITRSPSEVSTSDLFDNIANKVAKKTAQVKLETGEARGIMIVKSSLSRPDNQFVNDEHRKKLWERIIGKYDHISALLFLDRTSTDAKRSRHVGYFMYRHTDTDMHKLFEKFQAIELSGLHLE